MDTEDSKYISAWAVRRSRKWLLLRWCLLFGSVFAPCLYFWVIRTLNIHTNFLEIGMGSAGRLATALVIVSVPGVFVLSLITIACTILNLYRRT